ncbi:M23 family metallopeptidase [Brevundimonas sp.]|uniref:murein hydrolase activator EnvC family protein n=1 Tax=Brevundimonas sp. TaxID=1871086 RepID=UPI00261991A9|nr:M23 family metallopeptidase [Brevundimonas sp.]
MRRLPILLLLGLAAAAPAGGQTPDPGEVARLSGQYRDAVIRARSLEGQAREAARAAEAAPAPVDGGQTPDRAALDALAAREAPVLARLTGLRAQQGRLWSGLQRLTRHPPPPLFVSVGEAVDARRAGLLMRGGAMGLEARAAPLTDQRRALARERRRVVLDQAGALAADSAAGERRAVAADRRAERRARAAVLRAEATAARAEAGALARRLEGLGAPVPEVAADAASRISSLPAGRTRLAPPVSGPPEARFSRDVPGWRWTGDGGEARAPAPGRVAYAGPHPVWGQVVILDLGEGWQAVVAGLAGPSVATGDRIAQGAALGRSVPGRPLQVELRRDEVPVDPARFFP